MKQRDVDEIEHKLQVALAEKTHLSSKTEESVAGKTELEEEESKLLKEIEQLELTITNDSTMVESLDAEIHKLEL